MDKKRILVTGGAGFIGSNTCESLLNDGHQVVCLDNFITGRRENLDDFASNENFRLIVGDIRNLNDCKVCPAGTYLEDDASPTSDEHDAEADCTICAAGKYQTEEAQTSDTCIDCPAGTTVGNAIENHNDANDCVVTTATTVAP